MNSVKYIASAILFLPLQAVSQHRTQDVNMLWAGYYNTTQLNTKWSLASDVQARTKEWTNKLSQFLIRCGLVYSINNHVALTVGLAFFKNAQYIERNLLLKNEFRPWQEVSYLLSNNKIIFTQRLRTEERFLQLVEYNQLSKNYQPVFRTRYKFEFQFPVMTHKLKALAGNEIMVNPGHISKSSFFDQNRTSAGINFKLNSASVLQCQYVKIFQWHNNTSVMDNQNVIRFNFIQQFNYLKKG